MPTHTSDRQRLARLAAPLAPAKAPWFVRGHAITPGLEAQFPAEGWYWIPRGHSVAVFLARSARVGEYHLRRALEREELEQA